MSSGILASRQYIQRAPLSAATGASFSSKVDFEYVVPKGKRLSLHESYMSVDLEVSVNTPAAPLGSSITHTATTPMTYTSAACLSSNPVSCLFQKASHRINDVVVSSIDMVPQTSTMLALIGESRASIETSLSTNPIHIREKNTRLATADIVAGNFGAMVAVGDVAGVVAAFLSKMVTGRLGSYKTNNLPGRVERIAQACIKQDVAYSKVVMLNWVPCFGLFNSDVFIPGNTKHGFTYYIDANWFRQVVYGIRAIGGADDAAFAYKSTRDDAVAENGAIRCSIKGIYMYLALHDAYDAIPPSINFTTVETFVTTKPLIQQSELLTVNITPGTMKLIIGFIDSRYGSSTARSPTNFSITRLASTTGSNAGDVVQEPNFLESINEIGIQYAGESYPLTPYNLPGGLLRSTDDNILFPVDTESNETNRAFMDFLIASDSLADSSGSMYDNLTWAANPLFCFKLYTPAGDMSKDLTIKIKLSAAPVNVMCVVLGLHRKLTTLNYDQNGMVSSVSSTELI
jgi:hypothetical protein